MTEPKSAGVRLTLCTHTWDAEPGMVGRASSALRNGLMSSVFEKESKLGGMLTLGIPNYRLEKDVIGAEIDVLKLMGVKFKTGVEVGKDVSFAQLRSQGFDAFYVAIGAQSGRKLGLENEDLPQVGSGVDFLRHVNLDQPTGVSGKVVVIGGGNVAIDVARSSLRLENVTETQLYCLEPRDRMPAYDEEIYEALEEGLQISAQWGPVRILSENGKVSGVEFVRCTSIFDETGKFNPQYNHAEKIIVPCDHVLLSVGQTYRYASLFEGENVVLTERNTIQVNPVTLQTSSKDIFAGGDVASGPRLAIDAIAAGKEAAVSIHRYVHKGQSLEFGRDRQSYVMFDKENLADLVDYDGTERQRIAHVNGDVARTTFKDLRGILTEEQIAKETARCLGCGAAKVDDYLCVGCGACTLKCKFDAIRLERVYDVKGFEIDNLPKAVIKNALVRKAKISLRKINPFNTVR